MQQDQDTIETYINHVYDRGVMLIENRLWSGIDIFRYRGWWKNFSSTEERLLAALLIDRLIYRSEEHMMSMLYDLFVLAIPNCMRLSHDVNYTKNRRLLDLLTHNVDNHIRLVNINGDSQPSQSSGEIINLINHKMEVKREWLIYQKDIYQEYKNGARTFLLMDDMICTGEQIKTILDEIQPDKYEGAKFYVAVCCACDEGIKFINMNYPSIGIAFTELLVVKEHSFFNSIDYSNIPFQSVEKLKCFYEEFAKPRKFIMNKLYGKGKLALVYAFQNSTPNASLPILYWKNEKFNQFLNKRGS